MNFIHLIIRPTQAIQEMHQRYGDKVSTLESIYAGAAFIDTYRQQADFLDLW